MRVSSFPFWLVLATGCVVPAITGNLTTDKDVDADTDGVDTDVDDTPDDTDTLTPDTGLEPSIDTGLGSSDGDGNQTPLNCHPFDPASYSGWTRVYQARFPRSSGQAAQGQETHTAGGVQNVPSGVAGPVRSGYVTSVAVTNAAGNNYTADYFTACANQSGVRGAFDIGFKVTPAGNSELKGGANEPHKFLPEEIELYGAFRPGWQVNMTYSLKIPLPPNPLIPICPTSANGTREVDARYDGLGFETINVQGLGTVEAYHMRLLLDQTQMQTTTGFEDLCQFFSPNVFQQIFSAAFGFAGNDDGGFLTAQIDRWYVRGVGLVKEVAVDYLASGQPTLFSKELTSCSGLPNCP